MNKMLCFCWVVFFTINNVQTYIRPYKPVSINYWPANLTHSFLEIYLKAKAKSLKNNHPEDNSVARSTESTVTATSKKMHFHVEKCAYKTGGITITYPTKYFSSAPIIYVTIELNKLTYYPSGR